MGGCASMEWGDSLRRAAGGARRASGAAREGGEYREGPPGPQGPPRPRPARFRGRRAPARTLQRPPVRARLAAVSRTGVPTVPRKPSGRRQALTDEHRAALTDFLEALRVEAGLARSTLAAYRADLETFLAFATARGARAPGRIRAAPVVDWLAERRDRGLAQGTGARGLAAVRMF